jgi:hypothetical protein
MGSKCGKLEDEAVGEGVSVGEATSVVSVVFAILSDQSSSAPLGKGQSSI